MEEREKITPNDFGGEVGYRVKQQNFIEDLLLMKIETEDIGGALQSIKEEHKGKNVRLNEAASRGDEYVIEIS